MSGYHSTELCYLAAVYTNLLISAQPMEFCSSPSRRVPRWHLRVAPDLLPPGSVRIAEVEVDGARHEAYDADALTVRLPAGSGRPVVRVQLGPTATDRTTTHE